MCIITVFCAWQGSTKFLWCLPALLVGMYFKGGLVAIFPSEDGALSWGGNGDNLDTRVLRNEVTCLGVQ